MDTQTLVIALAGIGATLVAGLGGIYLGHRMEQRAESRREQHAVRRAARLIDADLMVAEAAARLSVKNHAWWLSDLRLTVDGWQQHRDVIAAELPWNDWVTVVVAVQAVGHLQGSRDGALAAERAKMTTDPETRDVLAAADALGLDIADPRAAISDTTVTQIEPMLRDVAAGRAALAPLTR